MNRRTAMTNLGLSSILAPTLLFKEVEARETALQPLSNLQRTLEPETYAWIFEKGDASISAQISHFEDESDAFRIHHTEAKWRGAEHNFEQYLEVGSPRGLYGSVKKFEGTFKRENRTPTWQQGRLYMGSKGSHGIIVLSNANESDEIWVVKSLIEDGLPVTPYGFRINEVPVRQTYEVT